MGGYEYELQETDTDSRYPEDLTSNISRLLGFATKNPESLREFLRIVEIVRSFLILKEYSTLIECKIYNHDITVKFSCPPFMNRIILC